MCLIANPGVASSNPSSAKVFIKIDQTIPRVILLLPLIQEGQASACQLLAEVCAKVLGPVVQSVVSLTSSLRVILLTVLADLIYKNF